MEQGFFPPNCWGFMAKLDDFILGAVFLEAHFDINKALYCQHKKLFSAELSKSVRRGVEYQGPPRWEMHMKCNLGLLPLLQFCVAKLARHCNIWSAVASTHAAGWPLPQFHIYRYMNALHRSFHNFNKYTVGRVFFPKNFCGHFYSFLAEMSRIPCCGRPESSSSIIW